MALHPWIHRDPVHAHVRDHGGGDVDKRDVQEEDPEREPREEESAPVPDPVAPLELRGVDLRPRHETHDAREGERDREAEEERDDGHSDDRDAVQREGDGHRQGDNQEGDLRGLDLLCHVGPLVELRDREGLVLLLLPLLGGFHHGRRVRTAPLKRYAARALARMAADSMSTCRIEVISTPTRSPEAQPVGRPVRTRMAFVLS